MPGTTRGPSSRCARSLRPCGARTCALRWPTGTDTKKIEDVEGDIRHPSGHYIQPALEIIWDAYHFDDLVPRGLQAYFGAGPGIMLPSKQGRHWVELEVIGAIPLARYTVLAGRFEGVLKNRGNPNHNYLIGSIYGVRGLEDSFYRSWVQGFVNVELRQALPLFSRLALQFVAFADAGVFERLTVRGTRGDFEQAVSAGMGARLVPTFLTQLLLRVDLARLLWPETLGSGSSASRNISDSATPPLAAACSRVYGQQALVITGRQGASPRLRVPHRTTQARRLCRHALHAPAPAAQQRPELVSTYARWHARRGVVLSEWR
jgi:hypothetical protein